MSGPNYPKPYPKPYPKTLPPTTPYKQDAYEAHFVLPQQERVLIVTDRRVLMVRAPGFAELEMGALRRRRRRCEGGREGGGDVRGVSELRCLPPQPPLPAML